MSVGYAWTTSQPMFLAYIVCLFAHRILCLMMCRVDVLYACVVYIFHSHAVPQKWLWPGQAMREKNKNVTLEVKGIAPISHRKRCIYKKNYIAIEVNTYLFVSRKQFFLTIFIWGICGCGPPRHISDCSASCRTLLNNNLNVNYTENLLFIQFLCIASDCNEKVRPRILYVRVWARWPGGRSAKHTRN